MAEATSCDLLESEEHALLSHLAAFVGGAELAALVQVSGLPGLRQIELAERLERLVARSLVVTRTTGGRTRYDLSLAVRERWCTDLVRTGRLEEPLRAQLAWCERFVARADANLEDRSDERHWLARLAAEQLNLHGALETALEIGDLPAAGRLAERLCRLWELRGPLAQGRSFLRRVLGAGSLEEALRARLLDGFGMLAWRQGDDEEAGRALREALALITPRGALLQVARSRRHLGLVALSAGQVPWARQLLGRCLSDLAGLDAPVETALVWSALALAEIAGGHLDAALERLERATGLQRALGDAHGGATSLLYRAVARYESGDLAGASSDARRAGKRFLSLGDEANLAWCLLVMACSWPSDQVAGALELEGLACHLAARCGAAFPLGWKAKADAALATARRAAEGSIPELHCRGAALRPSKALRKIVPPSFLQAPPPSSLQAPPRSPLPLPWPFQGVAASACVQALGSFQVFRDAEAVHLPPQVARLVKLLVVSRQGLHVDQVMEALWPEVAPARGRRRLRNVLSRLTRAAGPLVVRAADVMYLGEAVAVDVWGFEAAAREALGCLRGDGDRRAALARARAAHDLYTGDLLPEDRYEDFAIAARERLGRLRLRLLDAAAAAASAEGEAGTAETCLRIALEVDPTDEARYVALARLLLSSGRPAAAARVCSMARDLAFDLALPVSPAVAELEMALRKTPAGP